MLRLLVNSIFALLVISSCLAEEQKLELRNFKGLNTIDGDFSIQPTESRQAINIDWGRNVGSITKRYGYDAVSIDSSLHADSMIAIYGAYYSDGTQQLFVIIDDSAFGFGSVYVTPLGSTNLDSATKVWDYWSVFGYPSFTMANDAVYIVNGHSAGIVYNKLNDGFIVRQWPSRSPGEPLIVPITDTAANGSGELDGEYRYMIYCGDSLANVVTVDTTIDTAFYFNDWEVPDGKPDRWRPGDIGDANDSLVIDTAIDTSHTSTSTLYQGRVTPPIRVTNGRVFLSEFPYPNVDTVTDQYGTNDTMTYTIVRTRANSGRLTRSTEFFYIGEFKVADSGGVSAKVRAFRKTFIDSIPDTLSTTHYSKTDFRLDLEMDGMDSLGNFSWRYGSPRLLSIPDYITYNSVGTDTANFGIFYGIPKQKDTLGFAYAVTYIDTTNGIESDTGRSCFIWVDVDSMSIGKKPYSYQITLPQPKSDDSGMVINIYRGLIQQITYDSSYWASRDLSNIPADEKNKLIEWYQQEYGIENVRRAFNFSPLEYWVDHLAQDTVVINEYRLLAQVLSTDTLYTDSIRWDSLSRLGRQYSKSTSPALLSQIFSHQGRLWGVNGSRLWRSGLLNSLVDTLQTWGQMTFQSLNEFDGDIGTVAFPTRTSIRYMKNFSTHNIYDDFTKIEISGNLGCIAPNSYSAGVGGHYYLSDVGVIHETEGTDLERLNNFGLVSKQLDNFDKLSITSKSNAYGIYFDRKYMLTIGDTTYVYDERSGEWATWTRIKMSSATLFGTETNVNFIPGDTLYFIKSGDSTLYRYGTNERDNISIISVSWLSAPMLIGQYNKNMTAIATWINNISPAGGLPDKANQLVFNILDERDSIIAQTSTSSFDTTRYYEVGLPPNEAKYFQIRLDMGWAEDDKISFIDGLDIYYTRTGKTYLRK